MVSAHYTHSMVGQHDRAQFPVAGSRFSMSTSSCLKRTRTIHSSASEGDDNRESKLSAPPIAEADCSCDMCGFTSMD